MNSCIANGLPVKPPAECVGIDWTRLLQLNCNDNQVVQPAVSEEDLALFYSNARTDEINVIFPDNVQDSHFVTLAVEPATVLEPSTVCDTILSQRRMTCTARSELFKTPTITKCGTKQQVFVYLAANRLLRCVFLPE